MSAASKPIAFLKFQVHKFSHVLKLTNRIQQYITSFLTGSSFSDKINSIWQGDDM